MSTSSPPDPPRTNTTTTTSISTSPPLFTNPSQSQRDPKPLTSPLLQPNHHHPTTTFQPPFQRQQSLYTNPRVHPQSAKPQDLHQGILYPVASSGRGFLPKPMPQPTEQNVALANSGGCPTRPVAPYSYLVRPFGFPHSDPLGQTMQLGRPMTHMQQTLLDSTGGVVSTVVKGVPVLTNPKVAPPSSSVSDGNGYKDLRDDTYVTVRDRKVKISDGTSLYAQCRSWVKNGFSEENQPHYVDCVKSLPKPLPVSVGDANSQVKKDDDKEENEEDVEHLSAKELLQGHIKRAKKVRARLREERLERIARYKGRLALLLPPVVEQQFKNDSASGN